MTDKASFHHAQAPKRPMLLKLIALAYFLLPLLGAIVLLLLVSGQFPSPRPDPYFAQLGVVDHSLTLVMTAADVIAATLLWRLRKAAFYFFLAGLFLSIVNFWWSILVRDWVGSISRVIPAMTGTMVASMLVGQALLCGVCLYTWRLSKEGVLK